MKKFSLSFVDRQTEKEYMEQNWNTTTKSSFSFLSFGVIFAFGVRVIVAHISKDFSLYYLKLTMFFYTLIQHALVKWKPKMGRIGFLLLNVQMVTYDYFESMNLNVDNDISSLRGTNMMAASILFMQTGEFLDGVFSLSLLIIYQISKYFLVGTTINISVLMTTLTIRMYLFYYLYQFHKAKRSQYLLGVVETCWDKIFISLIHKPFILIKFNYQNFAFNIENSNNLPFINDNLDPFDDRLRKFSDAYYFLHHALIEKQTIQNYIYNKIKKFKLDLENIYNESIYAKYQNKQIMLKFSIFQAKDPLILIQIEPFKFVQKRNQIQMNDLLTKYTQQMVKLLDQITLQFTNYQPIKILKRKLIFIQCLDQILQNQLSIQQIDINSIVLQIKQLFPDCLVIMTVQEYVQKIDTFPNILLLFLILIINCSRNKKLILNVYKNNKEHTSFEIQSTYNIQKFNLYYKKLEGYVNLIVSNVFFTEKSIQFNLFHEPLMPFTIGPQLLSYLLK